MTRSRISLLFIGFASLSLLPSAQVQERAPELVLLNGSIVTVDAKIGKVQALAARGGRILAVGSNKEIKALVGKATKVIDLKGKTAIPGFIEGHGHFAGIGNALQILDLKSVRNWDEVVELVAEAVKKAKPGEWIIGRGWHQEKWDKTPKDNVEGFPTHASLSAVSPENPVCLTHASGHACFFNARAMKLASVDASTKSPKGGEILKDADGEPSGVFRETAQGLVSRVRQARQLQRPRSEVIAAVKKSLRLADRECLSKGVTSFQDAGSSFATIDIIKSMVDRGELKTRLWMMIRASNARLARDLAKYRMLDYGDGHLTVRAIKRTIDGALGSRGAWLLEGYTDSPQSTGLATASVESVSRTAELAVKHGYQLCVHAIGDRANREVLDIFEKIFKANPAMSDPRWRIEHAQHLDPGDIPRFARLGIIASMQAIHCTSDAPWVVKRLGSVRAEAGAYVWQKLMKSGALVTNGTDAPVEDVDPIASYYAAVSRRLGDGSVFFPKQRMSRMEALESYTINAAKAAFEEKLKGSLSPGKYADIVVLSKDILSVPEAEIPQTKVLLTIVGGEVVFERAGSMEGSKSGG